MRLPIRCAGRVPLQSKLGHEQKKTCSKCRLSANAENGAPTKTYQVSSNTCRTGIWMTAAHLKPGQCIYLDVSRLTLDAYRCDDRSCVNAYRSNTPPGTLRSHRSNAARRPANPSGHQLSKRILRHFPAGRSAVVRESPTAPRGTREREVGILSPERPSTLLWRTLRPSVPFLGHRETALSLYSNGSVAYEICNRPKLSLLFSGAHKNWITRTSLFVCSYYSGLVNVVKDISCVVTSLFPRHPRSPRVF